MKILEYLPVPTLDDQTLGWRTQSSIMHLLAKTKTGVRGRGWKVIEAKFPTGYQVNSHINYVFFGSYLHLGRNKPERLTEGCFLL